jgi:arginine exporter protein ArgO
MPQLIIALILIALAIWLAVMGVAVAFAAIPSWAAGMIVAGIVLLLIYQVKIDRLTSRENLV